MLLVLMLVFLSLTILSVYLIVQTPVWQLIFFGIINLAITLTSGFGMQMIRNNRAVAGTTLAASVIIVAMPMISFLISSLGIYLGISQIIGITLAIALVLPRRQATFLGAANGLSAMLAVLMGALGTPSQLALPAIQSFTLVIVGVGLFVFLIILAREFRNFGLQTKVSLGILIIGGVAVSAISFFAITRSGQLIETLTQRLETVATLFAEDQLVNQAQTEANSADQFFEAIADGAHRLAGYRIALQGQQSTLSQSVYWNAEEKLIPFNDGKYGNPSTDVSSVFVPSTIQLNEAVIKELNTSAYLDFSVPQLLEENSALLAVYYIDERGVVRYYPNIDLATLLPHDFDATQRPYYEITTPLSNPNKETRWTTPYVDAAGGGLVVTVAEPVYIQNRFRGVVAADIQLSTLTEQVATIQVGKSGYAFMLDNEGRVLSMPQAGYELFGLDPDVFSTAKFSEQTLLGQGSSKLQNLVESMVAGETGLTTVSFNNANIYIAYARIQSNGYSLAIVVPVSEMQTSIVITQNEMDLQIRSAINTAIIILIVLLVVAVLVSLGLGQIIAAPVKRLTQTANQILDGNLSAQAEVTSTDEIGTLAEAFNAMTSQLGEMLVGLERTIDNRTSELSVISQSNERRAKQFQSISQVARTISSTLDFDNLLNQITNVISREFGFYHVGVFLLDAIGEYAILSAANSDGGQAMLARGHRLEVGEKGLVGFVASTGNPRVALDVGSDAVYFNNPDMPNTRSEIALPLRVGENVIGVLDVQSTEPNAFSEEDVNILSALSDQVSIAIQNARQNERTKRALAESEALSQQFTQSKWSQFTRKKNLLGVRHTGAKATLLYSEDEKGKNGSSGNMDQLMLKGRGAVLSIPIKLRGKVIGSVDVRAPENRQWDQDEMDIVSAIIERAAVAMESSRLLTESQKHAAKERTIGEISAKISAQSSVDELIKTAAQELAHTLPNTEIAIQFRNEETE